jgi:ubiquinone/menaquinone biosynthesis C-methylase UbiE
MAIRMIQVSLWEIKEDRPMPNIGFRLMTFMLKRHEKSRKPLDRLQKIGLKNGQVVLDYGCGIGGYSIPAAKLVGEQGRVYALDIHPYSAQKVQKRAKEESLSNIETITSARETGLPDQSIDIVLLFDVLHIVKDKNGILREISRVIKPSGLLIIEGDHLKEEELKLILSKSELFNFFKKEHGTYQYKKKS